MLLRSLVSPPGRHPRAIVALALVTLLAPACRTVRGNGDEFSEPGAPPPRLTIDDVAREWIDARSIQRGIEFLASDELRGRGTPSPGLSRAAAWVGAELQRAGLDPAGQDGGYVQYWPGPDSAGAPRPAPNVIAVMPGADTLGREIVMVTAHVDGPGAVGAGEDSIVPAASDAAGVAVLVEVARALAALPDPPRRSVLFAVFSGSASGGGGSSWFAGHPTMPLDGAVALLNLDRLGGGEGVAVVGPGAAPLAALLDRVARDRGLDLEVRTDPGAPGSRLDHAAFARLGAPAASLVDGPGDRAGTPSDVPSALDVTRLGRIARLVFYGIHAFATDGAPEAD